MSSLTTRHVLNDTLDCEDPKLTKDQVQKNIKWNIEGFIESWRCELIDALKLSVKKRIQLNSLFDRFPEDLEEEYGKELEFIFY